LFWGPPGTGKSSLSTAIANYTNRNIFTITPSKDMTDSVLVSLISNKPVGSIIVFEDFDCLLSTINREDQDVKESRINISISCLLNILDGTYTPDDTIFVITTNDLDKIDSAIKRKGRTDMLVKIPTPSTEFLRELRIKFGIDHNTEMDSIQDIQNYIIERN
jgi:chaperone BCS1